jgi:hypothetical protein
VQPQLEGETTMSFLDLDGSKITASYTKLYQDACDEPRGYLRHAIKNIDEQLGKGYAKEHPELICAYMQAAAIECAYGCFGKAIQHVAGELAEAIQSVIQDMHDDKT